MKGANSRKPATRKGRTTTASSKASKTPSIAESAPLQDSAPSSHSNVSKQSEFWTQLIPIFNEYQKYCVERAAVELDQEDDAASHRASYLERMQFRSALLHKFLTAAHVNDIAAELNLVTISKDGYASGGGKESDRLVVISGCFMQALDCAVASLLTQEGTTSTSTSGSVACMAIFEFVVWASTELVNLENKAPPKFRDVLSSLGSGYYEKLCVPVLSHICKFAECSVDSIRIVAVRALCSMAECLGNNTSTDPSVQDWLDVLDTIQQALLPRFTDKAVAVRCAVVQGCFPSGVRLAYPDNPLRTDPDILQALQWIVQHDPSPNNRIVAIQHAPISLSTLEYIIPRMRDTKVGVRTAVLASISTAILQYTPDEPTDFLLPSRHIADIVTAGYTDRCLVTRDATCRMICTSWIKAAHFNPMTVLEWVNILENTSVASSILEIWAEAAKSTPSFVQDFSDRELRNFQHGLRESIAKFSIADIDVSEKSKVDDIIGRLFVARHLVKCTDSTQEKEAIWSQLVPDVSVLCHVLEAVVGQLVQVLATNTNNKDEESMYEDKVMFICQELLQLATINVGSSSQLEEGSRRILIGTIENLLSNVVTPDDLLEGCVSALKELGSSNDGDRFNALLSHMFPVIDQLSEISTSSDNELFSVHTSIRILSLITSVLETQESAESLQIEAVPKLMAHVNPAISHSNVLLRQAAGRTMGLLGSAIAVSHESIQENDFLSSLLSVATNVDEGIEIRIQAMFALTDWTMLNQRDERIFIDKHSVFVSLCDQVDVIFNAPNTSSPGTVCCAAEIATKLTLLFMLNRTTIDTFYQVKCRCWLARLVALYFDPKLLYTEDESVNDIHRVGNPVRLQQFLSSFFSAMTSTLPLMQFNQYLLDAIAPLLEILLDQHVRIVEESGKAKASAADVLQWTRSVDFIVSTVATCRTVLTEEPTKDQPVLDSPEAVSDSPENGSAASSDGVEEIHASSPYFGASLQIVQFLSQECSRINVAVRRGLCKSIASMMNSVDIASESWEDLSSLKELLEELVENDAIDDGPSRRTLSPVLQDLVGVESDACEENEEDDDVASLSDAFGKVDIDPKQGSENILPLVQSSTKSNQDRPETNLRRTRRLRTSN